MHVATYGLALALAALFALAAGHKVRVIVSGDHTREPLLRVTGWRRRHARLLLAGAAFVETATAVSLAAWPVAGMALGLALLTAYARELRRLDPKVPCNCFGSISASAAPAAIQRNHLLAFATFVALAAAAVDGGAVEQKAEAVGIAVVVLSALVAVEILGRHATIPAPSRRPSSAGDRRAY